jgi:beta-glucosidase
MNPTSSPRISRWLTLGLVFTGLAAQQVQADDPPYKQSGLPIEQRISDLLARMTPEEKARQLDMYRGDTNMIDKAVNDTHSAEDAVMPPDKAEKMWGDLGVGSIHDLYPTARLSNSIQDWVMKHSRLGIPVLFIEEGLHGSMAFDETIFPAPIGLGATFDPGLARQTGAALASEMRANGIDMVLGPVLDLARDPRWGRVEEDMGEDPYLTGQMGLAYVQGAQGDSLATDHTLIAEPKHFAGHGSPEGGINTGTVHIGEREMRTIMLKSFEPAFREGHAMSTMAAYHEWDGIPCASNPWLLTTILRDEWGFQGFVLSDLGAIRRLFDTHHTAASPEEAVWQAISAGVDMQFYDFPHDIFQNAIVNGMKSGKLPSAAVDRAVSGVLRVKFMLGLFDQPMIDPSVDARVRRSQEHLNLTLQSARESMCLLKNDGTILPLSKKIKTLAIIGNNADVAQLGDYSEGARGKHVTMLQGIRNLVPTATILYDNGTDIQAAIRKAQQADVVILGLGEWMGKGGSGEGFDVKDLDLPGNQEHLLEAVMATGKRVVLVLQNGRPLSITWAAEHVPAILEAWYPGERGGQAIAETLFGDNNPAGRLPVSFPRSVGQIPVFYNRDSAARTGDYTDGTAKPLYTFGHGLSYTTFHYGPLAVTPTDANSTGNIVATVSITNTGQREGDEVVQLYLRENTASVVTPIIALKSFRRIHLKAGETQAVSFNVPREELAVWNPMRQWVVEPGTYTAMVGGSSDTTESKTFVLP